RLPFFLFTAPAPTDFYTLSLHDALPISLASSFRGLLYETDLVVLDSEELTELCAQMLEYKESTSAHADFFGKRLQDFFRWTAQLDRKSTRLNSSHVKISYAVFCLKKKKK